MGPSKGLPLSGYFFPPSSRLLGLAYSLPFLAHLFLFEAGTSGYEVSFGRGSSALAGSPSSVGPFESWIRRVLKRSLVV